MEFLDITVEDRPKNIRLVKPNYHTYSGRTGTVTDIMISKGKFKAIWDDENGTWCENAVRANEIIDREILRETSRLAQADPEHIYKPQLINNSLSNELVNFNKWLSKCPDISKPFNQKIIFSDHKIVKDDYATFKLPYKPENVPTPAYDRLTTRFFDEEFRIRFEWAVGAIFSGASKTLQKMVVIEGKPGTGKSTMLDILQDMLSSDTKGSDGKPLRYFMPVMLSSLVSRDEKRFSLESFGDSDAIVGIDQDGDLSAVESNYIFNQLVSHDEISFDRKGGSRKAQAFNIFLVMGTNKGVRITDSRSGIIRRVLMIKTTGERFSPDEYDRLVDAVRFEYGGIVYKCLQTYEKYGYRYFDDDKLSRSIMQYETDSVYNFFLDRLDDILREEQAEGFITGKILYEWYKVYCEEANEPYPKRRRDFYRDAEDYFEDFKLRTRKNNSVFSGFKVERFFQDDPDPVPEYKKVIPAFLHLEEQPSIFDAEYEDCPAQYAVTDKYGEERPEKKWANVKTTLKDILTDRLHYVKVPENHIVIDFDLKGDDGEKSLERNIDAASKFPPTYAETSKSGKGLHLHYIYDGDVSKLSNLYSDDIEVKVFTGGSSLRRKRYLCNAVGVSHISSGLPTKGDKKVTDDKARITSEKGLRKQIERNLRKEIHPGTKPSIDFIYKILEDAYNSGLCYDVSDMRNSIFSFAAHSTHHSEYCVGLVGKMKFKSADADAIEDGLVMDDSDDSDIEKRIIFFDVEIFPNLFVLCWKRVGTDHVVSVINPSSDYIEEFVNNPLVGFNNRRYDNHILQGRRFGYNNEQLYDLSQRLVSNDSNISRGAYLRSAWDLSYTDIYDFCSTKQSLKKWEIALGIHHKELGLPWDQPVPEERWEEVASYCKNDVAATEAVFFANKGDWTARKILADLAGKNVNTRTNDLTAAIIFGKNKNPQSEFRYRFLGDKPKGKYFTAEDVHKYCIGEGPKPEGLAWFDGYTFENGVSVYRGENIKEGGRVFSTPGMYEYAVTEDVSGMHPNTIRAEQFFGKYTKNYTDLVDARTYIKHGDLESARKMFGGRLKPYLTDESQAKALSKALKIAINSVYGLTAAKFPNPFRDERNIDNLVAKRGALFMTDLKYYVQKQGFTVIHIKTDSIKVDHPNNYILDYIVKFGKCYGYDFEIEDEWSRICLINDAVLIGKTLDGEWKAVGDRFKVPYVYKTLFTKEAVSFDDLCETKAVKEGDIYLDFNEDLPEGEHADRYVGRVGLFCPMIDGIGAGQLYRIKDGKRFAIQGTSGYRWMEAERVKILGLEDKIDYSYFERLADDAYSELNKFGSADWFCNHEETHDEYVSLYGIPDEDIPF